jgi:molecular chaperone GrpE
MSDKKKGRSKGVEIGEPVGEGIPEKSPAEEPDRQPAGEAVKKKVSRRQLEKECAETGEEFEACRDKLLRLQAEFENYRKRQVREREIYRRSANEDLLRAMLPVLDNLERAVEHGEESADVVLLLKGVQLVVKQMRESFLQFGVKPVDALGANFDPHEHEAMSTVETDGDPPDGAVAEVYQKGYLLHGRVLRPAMVAVAKMVDERGGEGDK